MIPKREPGMNGPLIHAIGYGAMGREGDYGSADEKDAIATVQRKQTPSGKILP